MDDIFTVEVKLGFGTGNPTWNFAAGYGRAVSRSPKRAFDAAYSQAMRSNPGYGLVDEVITITKGSTLISTTY